MRQDSKDSPTPITAGSPRVQVSIVRASRYDIDEVSTAVLRSLGLIGGLDGQVKAGDRVFVKINHLSPASPPERGIVTHPVFTEAVLEILKETGAEITVGDDIESGSGDGFAISGFRQMCQRTGVRLVNLREAGFATVKSTGRLLDEVHISRIALDSDIIVNLPKLKTHSLTTLTGGIKNMYGIIPASFRRRYHGEFSSNEDFSMMLTDIFAAVRPHLTIMDGIIAMDGEGPAGGRLRNAGVILASRDTVALDTIAARITGLIPEDIYTIRYSDERGLGTGRLKNIEVTGENIKNVAVSDFQLPSSATSHLIKKIPGPLRDPVMRQTNVRPRVIASSCTACSECVRICPTGAAEIHSETARINQELCIQCLCCHEVCRYDAIALRRPLFGTMLYRLARLVRKIIQRRTRSRAITEKA